MQIHQTHRQLAAEFLAVMGNISAAVNKTLNESTTTF
jgi:hypothetical protein